MKRFHKILAFMLALVFLAMPLVSCNGKKTPADTTDSTPLLEDTTNNTTPPEQTTENTTAPAETTESTNPPAETTAPPDVPPVPVKEYNIVMLGNSFTSSVKVQTPLLVIAQEKGIKFNITQYALDGAALWDVVPKAIARCENELRNADFIFIQEFGGGAPIEYTPDMRRLITDIGADAKFYFYLYMSQSSLDYLNLEYNYRGKYAYDDVRDVLKNPYHYDIEPFPMPHFTNMLIRLGYIEWNSIFMKNDFHPNDMYGYFMSMIMYVTLTGDSCVGLLTDYLYLDSEWDCIAGETREEKLETLRKIQECIDSMVAEYQEALALYQSGKANDVYLTIYP